MLLVLLSLSASTIARAQSPPLAGACETSLAGDGSACCWPGQTWSPFLEVCVGKPRCPDGTIARGERCDERCTNGRVSGDETDGHCCWPGQAWSKSRRVCVGIPRCTPPLSAQGETCAHGCPRGQLVSIDSAGRCCWPGQVWSTLETRCRGIPYCPPGFVVEGERCESVGARSSVEPPREGVSYLRLVTLDFIDPHPKPDAREEASIEVTDSQGSVWDCTPPCSVRVATGTARIRGTGSLDFGRKLDVGEPMVIGVRHSRCGKACASGGLVALLLGVTTAVVSGLSLLSTSSSQDVPIVGLAAGLFSSLAGTFIMGFAGGDDLDLAPYDPDAPTRGSGR